MPRKRSENYEENLRQIAEMCLFDNCFMNACFKNSPDFAEHILRIILENPCLKVESVIVQDSYTNLHGHSSRLDIVACDGNGRHMNIEVQRDNNYAIPKRARYYSSLLDSYSLDKGEAYDKLRDSYVIFITEHDYFGEQLPIYHIDRMIRETGKDFRDGSSIIYVNGDIRDDTPLGKLMHDFACANPGDMHYNVLADRIRMFKESKEGINYMSSVLDELRAEERAVGFTKGHIAGRKEGRKEGINNTLKAISMLKAGEYTIEDIASKSGLSVEEVKDLQEEMRPNS